MWACVAIVNGAAVRTCITPVSAAEGKEIVTLEGLDAGEPHLIQKAFIDEQAAQCGFCLNGVCSDCEGVSRYEPEGHRRSIQQAFRPCRPLLTYAYARGHSAVPKGAGDMTREA